jgi:hypothetical protein
VTSGLSWWVSSPRADGRNRSRGNWRRERLDAVCWPACVGFSQTFLPGLNFTLHDSQDRVRPWARYACKSLAQFGITNCEFRQQMIPLVQQLPARDHNRIGALPTADLPRCKRVASTRRFRVNAAKVLGDRAARRSVSTKSIQLRVMPVAACSAPQYSLREEGLAPESHETAGVEVFGMQGPETHSLARLFCFSQTAFTRGSKLSPLRRTTSAIGESLHAPRFIALARS